MKLLYGGSLAFHNSYLLIILFLLGSVQLLKSQDSTFQYTEDPYYWSIEGCEASNGGTISEILNSGENFPLDSVISVRGNLQSLDHDNYEFFVYDETVKLDFYYHSTLPVYDVIFHRWETVVNAETGVPEGGYFNYFERKIVSDTDYEVNLPPGMYQIRLFRADFLGTCEMAEYEFGLTFSESDQPIFEADHCAVLGAMYEGMDLDVYFPPTVYWMYPYEFDMDFGEGDEIINDLSLYLEMDMDTANYYTMELTSPSGATATILPGDNKGIAALNGLFGSGGEALNYDYNSYGNYLPAEDLSVFDGEELSGIWKFKISYEGGSWNGPNYMIKKFCLVNGAAPEIDCSEAHEIIPQTTNAAAMHQSSLAGASPGFYQCHGEGNSAEKWFKFTAVAENMFIYAKGNGDFNAVVEVFDDCSDEALMCVNTNGAGIKEDITFPGCVIGEVYYYRVYNAAEGAVQNFETAVAHIPFVKLRTQDCGISELQLNSIIRSNQPSVMWLLANFMFEFTELEEPYNTYEIVSPNGSNPNFILAWFPQAENGRNYSVRVKTKQYQGPTWGTYGEACTIGISSNLPMSGLEPSYANLTYDKCDILRAVSVTGASNYKWQFYSEGDTIIYNSGSSNYYAILDQMGTIELDKMYNVQVFATINGQTAEEGPVRSFSTTDTVPLTSVTGSCGQTLSLTNLITAFRVCGAEAYMWKFSNTSQAQDDLYYYRNSYINNLYLHWVADLIPGDSYDVSVYAVVPSIELGGFGPTCNITIEDETGRAENTPMVSYTMGMDDEEIESQIYPNPSTGKVLNVSLNNVPEVMEIVNCKIYSSLGKLLVDQNVRRTGNFMKESLNLSDGLSAGIYFVKMTANDMLISTERLIVE